jgi:hypothetical protein
MHRITGEELRDVPMLDNDMTDSIPTTDKPLDTADGPGKADSELGLDVADEELLVESMRGED